MAVDRIGVDEQEVKGVELSKAEKDVLNANKENLRSLV